MSGYSDLTKLETSRNCLRRIARHDEQQFSKDSIVNVMEKFVKTVNIMDDTILVPCRLMDRQIGDSTDIIPATGKDSTANQLTHSSSPHGKRDAAHSKNVQEFLSASELFNLYTMLNALKKDLLWTGNQDEIDETEQLTQSVATATNIISTTTAPTTTTDTNRLPECENKTESTSGTNATATRVTASPSNRSSSTTTTTTNVVKGHVRRTSTASMASTASVSDSESDICNDNDSGLESDGNKSDLAQSSDGSSSASSDIDDCQKMKQANADKATELAKRCRRHLNGLYKCLEQMTEAANYLTARYQSDIGSV